MASAKEYILISDDDGHWYVCPADREVEAITYFRAMDRYWSPETPETAPCPKQPAWLDKIGGSPSLVRFKEYRIFSPKEEAR